MSQVHKATHRDPTVCLAFLEVMNLLKPPTALMRPAIIMRVVKDRLTN